MCTARAVAVESFGGLGVRVNGLMNELGNGKVIRIICEKMYDLLELTSMELGCTV